MNLACRCFQPFGLGLDNAKACQSFEDFRFCSRVQGVEIWQGSSHNLRNSEP